MIPNARIVMQGRHSIKDAHEVPLVSRERADAAVPPHFPMKTIS